MTEAFYRQDQEAFDRYSNIMADRWESLMQIEADLVYHGHFTRQDIATMKPLERIQHVKIINERFEEMKKARESS